VIESAAAYRLPELLTQFGEWHLRIFHTKLSSLTKLIVEPFCTLCAIDVFDILHALAGCGNGNAVSANRGSFAAGINVNMAGKPSAVPLLNSTEKAGANTSSDDDVGPSDFFEFGDFISDGVPKDANFPALKYAEGEWRYYMSEDDPETGGVVYNQWGFADLSLDYDKELVIISIHPRYEGDGYQGWPMEDPGLLPFQGGFDDRGALKLAGNGTVLYINQYFAWSGREYIMGEAWFSEEESGLFLMTRGQR
jgi:hypothetical protein